MSVKTGVASQLGYVAFLTMIFRADFVEMMVDKHTDMNIFLRILSPRVQGCVLHHPSSLSEVLPVLSPLHGIVQGRRLRRRNRETRAREKEASRRSPGAGGSANAILWPLANRSLSVVNEFWCCFHYPLTFLKTFIQLFMNLHVKIVFFPFCRYMWYFFNF